MQEASALPFVTKRMIDVVTINPVTYPGVVSGTEFIIDHNGEQTEVVAVVYAIDTAVTGGVLPSRSWRGPDRTPRMMFYVSDAIAPSARLFDQVMYCMIIDVPDGAVLRYPADLNVLIDQILDEGKCSYIVVFNEENKHSVITSEVQVVKRVSDAL